YMSPEQVEGVADLDGRADLYALGAMLYELFTGAMPWPGDTIIAIAAARLLRPPPDPRNVVVTLPEDAARVVIELMARRREDRVQTADDARRSLMAIARSSIRASD